MIIKTKAQLVKFLAERADVTHVKAAAVLDGLEEYVTAMLRMEGAAKLYGIGKLTISHRAAREVRRPTDGEIVMTEPKNVVKFSCSSTLRKAVQ